MRLDVMGFKEGEVAVAAYLPEWRFEGANWNVICEHVSHLILFSLEVGQPGSKAIAALDRMPRKDLLEEAKQAARRHGTRLMVCFGGNGRSAGFSGMVRKKSLRSGFVRSVVSLLEGYGLDGIDINWEYAGYSFGAGYSADDIIRKEYRGLEFLLRDAHEALAPLGKVVTLAYYPDGRQEHLLASFAPRYVELMHAMAYDGQGPEHSPLSLARQTIANAQQFAATATLGLPFYGRRQASGDWMSYEDLIQRHALGPEDDATPGGVSFNGVRTIETKVELALDAGLAGVMIWEVGQDCRLAPVTHGHTTHPATCPLSNDSLILAVSRAIERRGKRRARVSFLPEARTELRR